MSPGQPGPASQAPLERQRSGTNFRAGSVGNVAITYWTAASTKDAVGRVENLLVELSADRQGPLAFMVGIPSGLPAPDAAARNAFADAVRRQSARLRAVALVMEGTGLRNAANRAVVTAIAFLGDFPRAPIVCATPREAAAAIASQLVEPGIEPTRAEDIEEAYRQLATGQAG